MRAFLLRITFLPWLVPVLVAQTTWTVNSAGGAQFTTVQSAIAAAAPGDRIEVLGSGPYPAFVVNRGVDVEAMANAACASIEVVGVPAGSRARVANFRVASGLNGLVRVANCTGSILLSNLTPTTGISSTFAHPGLEITNCSAVFVDRGSYLGVYGFTANGGNSSGALITNSNVVMVCTNLTGNHQLGYLSPLGWFYDPGFPAIQLYGGTLVLLGAVLTPGTSSAGPFFPNGTPALYVQLGFAQLLGGCQLTGQQGLPNPGSSIVGNAQFTADNTLVGPFVSGASGTPSSIPVRPRLSAPPITSIGTNYALSIAGAPMLTTLVALDFDFSAQSLPFLGGTLYSTGNAFLTAVNLDQQGNGSYGFLVPNVPAARNRDIFAQGCALAGGRMR